MGVEKSFMLHSPNVVKIEVVKRSKVRRNNLSYMRQRSGKSARLGSVEFDRDAVNTIEEKTVSREVEEATPEVIEEKTDV